MIYTHLVRDNYHYSYQYMYPEKPSRVYSLSWVTNKILEHVIPSNELIKNGFAVRCAKTGFIYHQQSWSAGPVANCRRGEVQCSRCTKPFKPNQNFPSVHNSCLFHRNRFDSTMQIYLCCGQPKPSLGCAINSYHVWTGVRDGLNGPFGPESGFIQTPFLHPPLKRNDVYALDCEMCYTNTGMEATKVSVVDIHRTLVYESLISPIVPIIDYNTQFSGITAKTLNTPYIKSLFQVQKDLMSFINADTILVGHALHNDLRALKLVHSKVVDTSVIFPHPKGFPFRMSLKSIAKQYLEKDVQNGNNGHCSFEDSRACIELLLYKITN